MDILYTHKIYLLGNNNIIDNNRLIIILIISSLIFFILKYISIPLIWVNSILLSIIILGISNNWISIYIGIESLNYIIIIIVSSLSKLSKDNLSNPFPGNGREEEYTRNTADFKDNKGDMLEKKSTNIAIFEYYIINSISSILLILIMYIGYKEYGTINLEILWINDIQILWIIFIFFLYFKLANFPFNRYIYEIYPYMPYKSYIIIYTIPTIYNSLVSLILPDVYKKEILWINGILILINIIWISLIGLGNFHILRFLTISSIINTSIILLSISTPGEDIYINSSLLYIFNYILLIGLFWLWIYSRNLIFSSWLILPFYLKMGDLILLYILVLGWIGIPPTLGFYSKISVIYTLNNNFFYILILIIASIFSSLLYLLPLSIYHVKDNNITLTHYTGGININININGWGGWGFLILLSNISIYSTLGSIIIKYLIPVIMI